MLLSLTTWRFFSFEINHRCSSLSSPSQNQTKKEEALRTIFHVEKCSSLSSFYPKIKRNHIITMRLALECNFLKTSPMRSPGLIRRKQCPWASEPELKSNGVEKATKLSDPADSVTVLPSACSAKSRNCGEQWLKSEGWERGGGRET